MPAPPALQLNLFGGFELRDAAGQVVRLPTRKAEALLAWLALAPGRLYARDRLAGLLWADVAEDKARASLRQALSVLAKALRPGGLETAGSAVGLVADALKVDAIEFQRRHAGAARADLEQAVALYRGELLAGFSLDQPAYEEWLLAERERLREAAINALARLTAFCNEAGDADAAIRAAQQLLALDPLEEIAHRALMQIYAGQGRRAAALRQYQACVAVLRRELGTAPGTQTRLLYNELLRQRAPESAPAGPEEPALHETPLIGREAELEAVAGLLADLCANRGRLLALTGEAGIGKTRLTQELIALAVPSDVRVMVGRCYESQQQFPFSPWVEMFRAAGLAEDRTLLDSLEPAWRAELGALLPELPQARSEAPANASIETRRGRMFEAIVRLVGAIAQRGPLLLIVEDLHWSDDMSLRLLATAGRRVQGRQVSIVMTAREEEVASLPALRAAFQELDRTGALTHLRLAPLSRADTEALVRALARPGTGASVAHDLASSVWKTSEGNPFVVLESMRSPGAAAAKAAGVTLPDRVRDLIRAHLDRLSDPARRLVATAVAAGRDFDFTLLEHATGLGENEAAQALEELVRRQVLHVVDNGFDFVHDRIRRVADEALLPPARNARHVAIAEALEALHAHDLPSVYDRLAYHYARSDRHDKAVAYLELFAERAARVGAHERAIASLEEALTRLAMPASPGLGRRRLELLMRKSRSLMLLGRLKEVVETLAPEQAVVDAADDPRLAGPYYLRLGATFNYMGDRTRSTQHATRALQEAASCGDTATMGKAHAVLANDRFWGEPELGVEHGEQAVALLRTLAEPWWLGQAYWILGLNLSYRGRFDEALEAEAQARALSEAVGDPRLACNAAWATGFVHTIYGNLDAALVECRRGVELAPDPLSRMTAAGMLALAHVERGEPREAAAILDEAIPQAERFRFAPLHGLYLGFRGEAALQLGDVAAARELALRGEKITRKSGYFYAVGWTQRILARIARAAGEDDAARRHMEDAVSTFQRMGAPYETERARRELEGWFAPVAQ